MDQTISNEPEKNNIAEVLKFPFITLYNIIVYAIIGIFVLITTIVEYIF